MEFTFWANLVFQVALKKLGTAAIQVALTKSVKGK